MILVSSSGFTTREEVRKPCSNVLWAWSCGAVLCRSQPLTLLFFLLQEDNKNYLTLVEQYGDGMLVCGTGACAPTCWNLVCCGHL